MWSETFENFFCHVRRLLGIRLWSAEEAALDIDLGGLVEANHDVSRMEICVDEVVDQEHVEEGIKALVCNLFLEDTTTVLQEVFQRNTLSKLFDQNLTRSVLSVGVREPGGRSVAEVLSENGQVGGFDTQIKLQTHHLAKLFNLIRERKPLHGRDQIDERGHEAHNFQVSADNALDLGMENLDGNVLRRGSLWRTLQGNVNPSLEPFAIRVRAMRVEVFANGDIRLQSCFVDLSYSTNTQWLLVELIEDFVEGHAECSLDCLLSVMEGVSGSVGVESRHDGAHLGRENVCSGSSPLAELDID